MNKVYFVVITLSIIALLSVGCRQVGSSEEEITIHGSQDWVDVGHTSFDESAHGLTLNLTVKSTGAVPVDLTNAIWSSSDSSVATVSGIGLSAAVSGVTRGNATITVETIEGLTASYEIQVVESMIIQWDLSKGAGTTIELPLASGEIDSLRGTENWEVYVDWGDSSEPELLNSEAYSYELRNFPSHTYPDNSIYTMRMWSVTGELSLSPWSFYEVSKNDEGILAMRPTSAPMLIDILRFGDGDISNTRGVFAYCENLNSFTDNNPLPLSGFVAYLFLNSSFNQDVSGWNIDQVENMAYMFQGATSFNNGNQPLNWDVKNVKIMPYMFHRAESFNQNISNWDVAGVTNMRGMFSSATVFTNKDVKLDWTLHPDVVAPNEYYTNEAGYAASAMYNMFAASGMINALTKHPDGCTCDIAPHKL